MVLTAIVITFGVTAFLLALAFRSWLLTGEDEVQDDVEDRRIAALEPEDARPARRAGREDDDVMRVLVPLPVVLPLLAAALSTCCSPARQRAAARGLGR